MTTVETRRWREKFFNIQNRFSAIITILCPASTFLPTIVCTRSQLRTTPTLTVGPYKLGNVITPLRTYVWMDAGKLAWLCVCMVVYMWVCVHIYTLYQFFIIPFGNVVLCINNVITKLFFENFNFFRCFLRKFRTVVRW